MRASRKQSKITAGEFRSVSLCTTAAPFHFLAQRFFCLEPVERAARPAMSAVSPTESAGTTAGVASKTACSTGLDCGYAALWGRPSLLVACHGTEVCGRMKSRWVTCKPVFVARPFRRHVGFRADIHVERAARPAMPAVSPAETAGSAPGDVSGTVAPLRELCVS